MRSLTPKLELIFCMLIALMVFVGRWYSNLYPHPLSADEAQAAANTFRIAAFGFNWGGLDGTTVGPLNSLILMWPKIAGSEVTFFTTRITASVLLSIVCISIYFTTKAVTNQSFVSMGISGALTLFYSISREPDFIHYSSELLPICLIILAISLMSPVLKGKTPRFATQVAGAGLLLGLVPFAKLQAVPIAAATGSLLLIAIFVHKLPSKLKQTILLCAFAILPAILALALLLSTSNFEHFWNSYILNATMYIAPSLEPSGVIKLATWESASSLLTTSLAVLAGIIVILRPYFQEESSTFLKLPLIFFSCLFVVALICVARPGRLFPHYIMLALPFLALWCGVLFQGFNRKAGKVSITVFVVSTLYYANAQDLFKRDRLDSFKTIIPTQIKSDYPLFSWLNESSTSALIWGWMPQWYVWGELTPASRETHTQAQIRQNDLTPYFRERLLEDVRDSQPLLIIDSVGGSSFAYKDRQKQGIESFTSLKAHLSEKFTEVSKPQYINCPKLYLNNLSDSSFNKLIPINSVEVIDALGKKLRDDAWQHINDYSVSEDMCIDYAFFPINSEIILQIAPNKIQNMLILNSHGGHQYSHATNEVQVTAHLDGFPLYTSQLRLASHPYWTNVSFPEDTKADQITIEILSYHGNGAGLNEVKLYSP
jgi:hypothetical protein